MENLVIEKKDKLEITNKCDAIKEEIRMFELLCTRLVDQELMF